MPRFFNHGLKRRRADGSVGMTVRPYLLEAMEPRRMMTNMLVLSFAPTTTSSGSVIDAGTGVQVTVETSAGAKVTTSGDSITLSLGTNPTGAILNGTTTTAAVSGVATFSTLYISQAANGYKLLATDTTTPATTSATSGAFNINAIPFYNTIKSLTLGNAPFTPYSGLIRDSAGNLYGTTQAGGLYDNGSVYELSGTTLTTLVSFSGDQGTTQGDEPLGALLTDSSGNLYGTTSTGGTDDDGTIFELSGTSHSVFTTLVSFTGDGGSETGSVPQGTLAIDSSGNIFGTTASGGSSGDGTAFELIGASHSFASLFSFTGSSGNYPGDSPDAGLVIDTSGNLYGTTDDGGTSSDGQVFELTGSNHTTLTSIYSFVGNGSVSPNGLVLDSSNNLYGTTLYAGADGDGTVYELAVSSHAYTTLVTFTGQSPPDTGEAPCPGMVFYGGNLFGMTSDGGPSYVGNIFELSGTNHTTFTPIMSFTGSGESVPYGGLCADSSGDLYGTTAYGGNSGLGNIFEVPASNRMIATNLFSFNAGAGAVASSALIYSGGNLYGTVAEGGPTDDGGIFELSGTGFATYSAEYFSAGQGSDPDSTPIVDGSGNLYGTTLYGGANGTGAVYEVAASTHALSTLFSFPANSTNTSTTSYLTLDSSADLYISYTIGDNSNDGTVVELSGTTHATQTTLVSFTGTAGADPGESPGQLVYYNSALFGTTTSGGGSNDGTLFELSGTGLKTYTKLITFVGSNGSSPGPDLFEDSAGNLFGTTTTGGTNNDGTVFEDPATRRLVMNTVVNFNGTNGTTPETLLTADSSGNLYGTTATGGSANDGTVYELSGTTHGTFTTLASFTGLTGSDPGMTPSDGVSLDSNGNVYGSTSTGGAYNDGVLFELTGASHTTFNTLYACNEANTAANPGLVADSSGNLYGTTIAGGTYQLGSVFELNSSGVANINTSTGTIAIATPVNGNNYFSSITAGAGSTVAISPTSAGHSVIITGNVTATGQLDITNNDLDIDNSSLSTVTNEVAAGYNNGTWAGQGITSSNAAGDTTHVTALGVIQNNQSGTPLFNRTNLFDGTSPAASDILVKYTYYGDANLSGKVDGSDYALIDNGYINQLTGWYNGDFNYDGVVNGSDYTLIDNSFNRQGVSLASQIATPAAPTANGSTTKYASTLPPAIFSALQIQGATAGLMGGSPITSGSVASGIFGQNGDQLLPNKRIQFPSQADRIIP